MKIEDPFKKVPVSGSGVLRKAKSAAKPNTDGTDAASAKSHKAPKLLSGDAKPSSPQVDSYESSAQISSNPPDNSAPIRADRVEHARRMVASGAYGNQEVIDRIIDRLIEAMKEV
jgi:hypothetical protein